jgi:hypothetical protein
MILRRVKMKPFFNELRWESDYDGEDIGYEGVDVVGFYSWRHVLIEINVETGEILNISVATEEELEVDRIGC